MFRSPPRSPPPSPPPMSPSLSESTYSDGSPQTPPTLLPTLPGTDVTDAQMHPLLAYGSSSILAHDLGGPLGTSAWPVGMLSHAATYPSLPSLMILHDMIPYPITIMPDALPFSPPGSPALAPSTPSSRASHFKPFVRVADVVITLQSFLLTPLTPAELAALPLPHATSIEGAFASRRERLPTWRARMLATTAGIARADLLLGATRFAGLKPTKYPDIWVLETAMP
jgi:hypothetical protein